MTFKYTHIPHNSTQIHLLAFAEFDPMAYSDKLTASEIERMTSFKHINRRREFVATRLLRHQIFGFEHIHYDNNGAPFMKNQGYISISHQRGLVGIGVNEQYKTALDLESLRPNILTLKNKFLSEEEKDIFDTNDPLVVTKIWSAKEVLYKLAGRKQIFFKQELLISKNENEQWIGTIDNHDHRLNVKLDIFDINGTIISLNSEPIEYEE